MRRERGFLERIAERADLPEEALQVQPIVEIAGDNRVLVENHRGVFQYTQEKIGIHVRYGRIQVCGCHLHLTHMTREKLIISGRIDGVSIIRRDNT